MKYQNRIKRQKFIMELRSKKLTFEKIGKLLNISRQRICQIINFSYKTPREIKEKKENKIKQGLQVNTRGLSHLTGRGFTREAVRRRDNYTCQICFRIWKNGRKFDVHHLNDLCGKKSKKYDKVTATQDLTTLCHKCHLNLDGVRQKMRNGKKVLDKIF